MILNYDPIFHTLAIVAPIVVALLVTGVAWRHGSRSGMATASVLAAWLALALLLGSAGWFRANPDGYFQPIALGLVLPIAVGLFLFRSSPALRTLVAATPQRLLVGVQLYRVLGLLFIAAYFIHGLYGTFAWLAGIGDILVGIAATGIALLWHGRTKHQVRTWNYLGIADLVMAVSLGFLSSPGPFQLLSLEAPNVLITAFPLVLVPTFAVPLSILLHLASLWKLRVKDRHTSGQPADSAVY